MEGVSYHYPECSAGGNKQLSIVYFNARSLVPKFDELCSLVEAMQPDIVCITESWLCTDILDTEVRISGYSVHRLDRNRHGGGIIMYTRDDLVVTVIPNFSLSLEFLPVSIRLHNFKLCICIFYRPPSSLSSIFDTFSESLEKLDISQFSNFICLGDFNVDINNPSHPFSTLYYYGVFWSNPGCVRLHSCFPHWSYIFD